MQTVVVDRGREAGDDALLGQCFCGEVEEGLADRNVNVYRAAVIVVDF